MRRPIRLVAPFLPLPASRAHHEGLAAFDWLDSIGMLSHSAELACGVPVQVITDVEADLPLPCLRYRTAHRRLMLWVLEVCACYLESDAFDRDTVCLDCDQLIHLDLAGAFVSRVDLGVLLRLRLQHRPTWKKVINGVQFWAVRAKVRLAAFYRAALAAAETMSDELIQWGADTEALRVLLEPMSLGLHQRHGLRAQMIDATRVSQPLSQQQIDGMARGQRPRPLAAVTDFRYRRKLFMRQFFEMAIEPQGAACVS